jgi:hypothetical protein
MHPMFHRIRTRLAPAGIALTAAGLITYTTPTGADAQGSDAPSFATATPGASLGLLTFPPIPSGSASGSPNGSPSPSVGPTPVPKNRVATRVTIPALGIDLPIIKPPPPDKEPSCNVAMYLSLFSQPGLPGITYLYAHARTGMFLPLLLKSQVNNGASMKNLDVFVYTSDDQVFQYTIYKVHRHFPFDQSLTSLKVNNGELWLQTSEGPNSFSTKLQVVARFIDSGPASHADAHPKAHPIPWGRSGCQ